MTRSVSSPSAALALAGILAVASVRPAVAGAPPKGPDSKHQNPRACELVTASDIASSLKLTVGEPQAQSGRGAFSCNFNLADGSGRAVRVELRTGTGARPAFLQKRSDGPTVFGVGDEAVWLTHYSTLLVLTRDNEVLAIDLTSAASAMKRPAPKDGAVELAKKALSKL
ncbi:MAG: hypothetical protein IPK07_12530 [Deltaproteobacteria bacterium]|jgi:hypothetical protein|nr:hypothetical protein [Deltaproteobacteria bacterium]